MAEPTFAGKMERKGMNDGYLISQARKAIKTLEFIPESHFIPAHSQNRDVMFSASASKKDAAAVLSPPLRCTRQEQAPLAQTKQRDTRNAAKGTALLTSALASPAHVFPSALADGFQAEGTLGNGRGKAGTHRTQCQGMAVTHGCWRGPWCAPHQHHSTEPPSMGPCCPHCPSTPQPPSASQHRLQLLCSQKLGMIPAAPHLPWRGCCWGHGKGTRSMASLEPPCSGQENRPWQRHSTVQTAASF